MRACDSPTAGSARSAQATAVKTTRPNFPEREAFDTAALDIEASGKDTARLLDHGLDLGVVKSSPRAIKGAVSAANDGLSSRSCPFRPDAEPAPVPREQRKSHQ